MPTRSEVLRARRRAVGGRRPRCRKGKSCSAACINQNKFCLVDAPTPVAGALPRAVKAIQSRGERLGRKEKQEKAQKQKEFAKGKLQASAELKKQRADYIAQRSELVRDIRKAMLSGDSQKSTELQKRLIDMEGSVGSKLKVRSVGRIDEVDLRRRVGRIKRNLQSMGFKLQQYSQEDRKGSYDKLERKYIKLQNLLKRIGVEDSSTNYEKGAFWKMARMSRKNVRQSNLLETYDYLATKAKEAAQDGNLKEYRKYERSLLKISPRIQQLMGEGRREKIIKGLLWKDEKVPPVLKALREGMDKALASGDLDKYNRLEDKFLRVKGSYERMGGYYARLGNLRNKAGIEVSSVSKKGQVLNEHIDQLKRDTFRAANSRNRREYNSLESKLLKLVPGLEKGSIWKERVQSRVRDYIPKLRQGMRDAAIAKDRKKYNKLERALLRLDPGATKGKIWRETRAAGYLPTLREKLKAAAIAGNRKEYNKLERVLFRMNRDNPSENVKGKVWNRERVGGAISKLAEDMEKAAREGDRAKYDRLEDRFFRIKKKVGNDAIRDIDLRYMSRGDVWREVERSKPLEGMQAMLEKDKRKGVESIKVKGGPDDFSVVSRVLGNKVELKVSPNDTTSFLVNDSYTASGTLSKREEFAITREVMRQYGEIVKQMPDGTVFYVTAASGDGREEMREQAYVKFGFSDPDYNGQMYGMVRNGKMTPIDEDDYRMAKAGGYDDDDYED